MTDRNSNKNLSQEGQTPADSSYFGANVPFQKGKWFNKASGQYDLDTDPSIQGQGVGSQSGRTGTQQESLTGQSSIEGQHGSQSRMGDEGTSRR